MERIDVRGLSCSAKAAPMLTQASVQHMPTQIERELRATTAANAELKQEAQV